MENLLDRYTIKFDDNNSNAILIYEGKKLINAIACPPVNNSVDIINLFNEELNDGYNHNFGGFVLITTPTIRTIYYKGKRVDSIVRPNVKKCFFNL